MGTGRDLPNGASVSSPFRVFLTPGPVLHYLVGSQYDNGEMFMHNITLWWGCPWTLSVDGARFPRINL